MPLAGTEAASKFRVGDWASFLYGPRRVLAQVIEDRGRLGGGGRRLYRVALNREEAETMLFEVRADDMSPAPPKPALLDYLKNGGLVRILEANVPGGRNQPSVWLTSRPNGRIVHTFTDSGHDLGGAVVPFNALHDGKVFTPERDRVVQFLTTIGLTRSEAESVVFAVGTAP